MTYGYDSKTHPRAPLLPQPHGYLRGLITRRAGFEDQRRRMMRLTQIFDRQRKAGKQR